MTNIKSLLKEYKKMIRLLVKERNKLSKDYLKLLNSKEFIDNRYEKIDKNRILLERINSQIHILDMIIKDLDKI